MWPGANHEIRGRRPQQQKNRIRNDDAGGSAATVAGDVGPGFHNWPIGHILQDTDSKPLIRPKKAFGETFGATTRVSDHSYRNGGFADWIDFLDRVSGDGVALPRAGSNDAVVCASLARAPHPVGTGPEGPIGVIVSGA